MADLKELLKKECAYVPADDTVDEFLHSTQEIRLTAGDILIDAGKVDRDMYIVADGVVRLCDMNGVHERTFGFGIAGTIVYSKHSFVKGIPSYYQGEACCDTTVLRITRQRYNDLVDSNPDFAKWMLAIAQEELFYQEYKNSTVNNGTAKERLLALKGERPEIIYKVSQKILASYLGISPEYLCRLRKKLRIN